MGLIVREFREDDTAALSHVWSLAFRGGKPRETDEPIVEGNSVYVAEVDGEVVGGFTVEHMDATRGDAVLRCGGIAGVAVLPESRLSGIGEQMMHFALDRMRADGYLLSSLYPFKEGYYRRFGYETAGQRFRISIQADKLPDVSRSLPVRAAGVDDWQAFAAVYGDFARRYSGMWTRSEMYWRHFLREDNPSPARYLIGDPAEAYVVIRQLGDFWTEMHVSELAWTTPEGYRNALALLKGIGVNRGKIVLYEPSDSPFLAQYFDYGAEVALYRPIMFRVIDVPGALRQLRPEAEGEFTVEVGDAEIPSNRGPWRVQFSAAGVCVEPTSGAELRMDVRQFTQALLGQPSLDRLQAHGLLDGEPGDALLLLPPRPVCCYNFF